MDDERRLRRFFARLHAEDAPPPFERLWREAARRARPRPRRLAPAALAATLLAAAALVWLWPGARGGGPGPEAGAAELAAELSGWTSPLAFLGEVPGSELFGTRPLPAGEAEELLRLLEASTPTGETL